MDSDQTTNSLLHRSSLAPLSKNVRDRKAVKKGFRAPVGKRAAPRDPAGYQGQELRCWSHNLGDRDVTQQCCRVGGAGAQLKDRQVAIEVR